MYNYGYSALLLSSSPSSYIYVVSHLTDVPQSPLSTMLPLSLLYFYNIASKGETLEAPSLPPWSSYQVTHMGQYTDVADTQGGLLLELEYKMRRQKEQKDLQDNQPFDALPKYTLLPTKDLDYKTAHNLAFYGSPWQGGIKKDRSSTGTNVWKEDWKHYQGLVWFNQENK